MFADGLKTGQGLRRVTPAEEGQVTTPPPEGGLSEDACGNPLRSPPLAPSEPACPALSCPAGQGQVPERLTTGPNAKINS